jgi:alkylation response protein AidB-like acyl-CoA dehydrogenase
VILNASGEPITLPNGKPEAFGMFLRAAQVKIEGNWDVFGLQATGSVDFVIDDEFVPREHVFPLSQLSPKRGRPFFRSGFREVAAGAHTAVAAGVATRALHEIRDLALSKVRDYVPDARRTPGGPAPSIGEQQMFQHDFAAHDAAVQSARSWAWMQWEHVDARVDAGEFAEIDRQRLWQACLHMHNVANDACRFAFHWGGTNSLRRPSALGRCMTDMAALKQHHVTDPNVLAGVGATLLGLTSAPPAGK